jgi:rSAM-partnered protein
MEASVERVRVADRARADDGTAFEVFVRDDQDGPLRHAGSVAADDATAAYEQASRVVARGADDVWVCPADAVDRYTTHDLDADAEPAPPATSGDDAASAGGDAR